MMLMLVFLPFVMAVFSWLIGEESENQRDWFVIIVTGAELLISLLLLRQPRYVSIPAVFGSGLHFMNDGFRTVYAIVTALMWFGTTVFSREYFRHERKGLNHYFVFILMTLGATEGVMLSADLMTTFVFFEILSFTSFTWVIHEQTPAAVKAGYTYLFIAVIGGLVLFMGLALLNNAAGTLSFLELRSAVAASGSKGRIFAAAVCILLGFGCKAGMFPVHVWLPKAHPVAPSPASALLSGILTKVGIYGILMTTMQAMMDSQAFGMLVLCLGLITMVLGAVLALFSVNLKRTLACSSMSQIGFILTGTGMLVLNSSAGNEEGVMMALCGTMLHMVNHSLIKLTLFMAAGVVVMNLGTLTLDDIRGWGKDKPFLKAAFALGALGISGVPFFNGYISKTLLHEGIVEGIRHAGGLGLFLRLSEWIFLIAGGITFAYMLKLFICIFMEEEDGRKIAADVRGMAGKAGAGAQDALLRLKISFGLEDRSAAPDAVKGGRKHEQAQTDTAPVQEAAAAAAVEDGTGSDALHRRSKSACMDTLSTVCVFGSSLLMPVLGQPFIMRHLAAFMTGEKEILSVRLMTWSNLSGSFISLGIGILIYIFVVKRYMAVDGSYVDLWPQKLDLEDLVYRPLLTRWLPLAGEKAAVIFAENRLLIPAARGIFFACKVLGRVLVTSTDTLIVLLRRTILRETKVESARKIEENSWMTFQEEVKGASQSILESFSFALMMTCIGIVVILGVLIYYIA